jgi:hypothetical protein
MSATRIMLPPGDVGSVVLAAAQQKAQELGITIDQGAMNQILNKALPTLTKLNVNGEIPEKRGEIEQNTASLIQYLFDHVLAGRGSEITLDHTNSLFKSFCERFPDFIPFCP